MARAFVDRQIWLLLLHAAHIYSFCICHTESWIQKIVFKQVVFESEMIPESLEQLIFGLHVSQSNLVQTHFSCRSKNNNNLLTTALRSNCGLSRHSRPSLFPPATSSLTVVFHWPYGTTPHPWGSHARLRPSTPSKWLKMVEDFVHNITASLAKLIPSGKIGKLRSQIRRITWFSVMWRLFFKK